MRTSLHHTLFSLIKLGLILLFCLPPQRVQAGWINSDRDWIGNDLKCPNGQVMVGACTSGNNRDCIKESDTRNKVSHVIRCESLEGDWFKNSYSGLAGEIRGKIWKGTSEWGDVATCSSGDFATGLCSSGGNKDCRNGANGRNVPTKLECASGPSTIALPNTGKHKKCANHGVRVQCSQGFVVTRACTAGGNDDCRNSIGCGRNAYTALECRRIDISAPTSPPTPKPISPTTPSPVEPSSSPAQESCLDKTGTILEEVDLEYNDTGVVPLPISVNDEDAEFVDFSVNAGQNAVYRSACIDDVGGVYKEITYKMECSSDSSNSVDVYIMGHPRCYASICGDGDQQALLNEYSIRLTEERNTKATGDNWKCTGELTNNVRSGCEFETEGANKLDNMIISKVGLTPTVKQKEFLGFFPTSEYLVTFPEVSDFESTCGDTGYIFHNIAQANAVCTSPDNADEVKYDVRDFQVCLGVSCNSGNSDTQTNAAIMSQLYNAMVDSDDFDASMKCTLDGNWSAASSDEGTSFRDKYGIWLVVGAAGAVILGLVIVGLTMKNASNSSK